MKEHKNALVEEVIIKKIREGKPLSKKEIKEITKALSTKSMDQKYPIFNSAFFKQVIEKKLAEKQEFAISLIDLDWFRAFNSRQGHLLGDLVLKWVSEILMKKARENNGIAARYGGEEFLLYLPKTLEETLSIIEETKKEIKEEIKRNLEKKGINQEITASVGVAHTKNAGKKYEALLKAADYAMRIAKKWPLKGKTIIYKKELEKNPTKQLIALLSSH